MGKNNGVPWPKEHLEYLERKQDKLTAEDLVLLAGLFDRTVTAIKHRLYLIAAAKRLERRIEATEGAPRSDADQVQAAGDDHATEWRREYSEFVRRWPGVAYGLESIRQRMRGGKTFVQAALEFRNQGL
jgi:hypothetical protein